MAIRTEEEKNKRKSFNSYNNSSYSYKENKSHILLTGDNKNDDNSIRKIEIKVSDTGSGAPEDILPHLFGKFITFPYD